jgi:DNA polymerase III epsilon subunit-like protein
MCARLGVTNEKAHSALADARATFLCYVALQKKFREIGRIVQITKDNVIRHNELNLLVSNLT